MDTKELSLPSLTTCFYSFNLYKKIFAHINNIFGSYSWPDGSTKLTKKNLRETVGTLGVTKAKQNSFFSTIKLYFFKFPTTSLVYIIDKNIPNLILLRISIT